MPRRLAFFLVVFLALAAHLSARAAPVWSRIRSANFDVCGDVGPAALGEVADRLEQFRAVLGRVLPRARFGSRAPTLVVVFSSHKAFEPFKPRGDDRATSRVAGFFISRPGAHLIALTIEAREEPYPIIYHEFTHQVLASTLKRTPVWLNEGMAEFYGSFAMSAGGRRVVLGRPIERHVQILRQRFMPLAQLFGVGHDSPAYTDPALSPVFYAESWALVHYLMVGSPERAKQLGGFLNRLGAGVELDEALRDGLGIDTDTLEKGLRQYVRQPTFRSLAFDFDEAVAGDSTRISGTMTEAAVEAVLGDLLLGHNRLDEAERRLERARRLDPHLGAAQTALGFLRQRQNRLDEALTAFEQGADLMPDDYAALSAFGAAVVRAESRSGGPDAPGPALRAKARQALERAVSLVPDDSNTLADLAFLHLVDRSDLGVARVLLERAIAADPADSRPPFILAQVHLAEGDLAGSRKLLSAVVASAASEDARTLARQFLQHIDAIEARRRPVGEPPDAAAPGVVPPPATGTLDAPAPATPADPGTRRFVTGRLASTGATVGYELPPLGKGEVRSFGELLDLACPPGDLVTATVRTIEGPLQLVAGSLAAVDLVSFVSPTPGTITCGQRRPPERVLVTWRPGPSQPGATATTGALVSVAFVPRDWTPIR